MREKPINDSSKNRYLIYIFPIIFSILLLLLAFIEKGIWADECWTLNIIKLDFVEMMKRIAIDVHPPLYFSVFKLITTLFGIVENDQLITFGKVFSIIPMTLLMFLGTNIISRNFDDKRCVLFNILVMSSALVSYSTEIRSYSWVCFFVTMAFLHYLVGRTNYSRKQIRLILVYSILASYTHYLGIISIGLIYIFVLIFDTKMRKEIMHCIIVDIICCVPWFIYVFVEKSKMGRSLTFGRISDFFNANMFKEILVFPFYSYNLIVTSIFALIILAVFVQYIYRSHKKQNLCLIFGFLSPALLLMCEVILSFVMNADFYAKYLLPMLGIFFLCISFFIDEKQYLIVMAIICINSLNYYDVLQKALIDRENYYDFVNFANGIDEVIFDDEYTMKTFKYYLENENITINVGSANESPNDYHIVLTDRIEEYYSGLNYAVIDTYTIRNINYSICVEK